jgi:hypothetical protein
MPKSTGIRTVANNLAMGGSDVSVDGSLQSRYGNNRCPEAKQFSSTKYKSHWRVPEIVARTFDDNY